METKSFESPELATILDKYSPIVKEARKRIVFTLLVFSLATLVGFVFYERIIKFLIGTLALRGTNIVFTSPFQFINLAMSTGVATGLVIVFPLIIVQILHFLRPALKRKEFNTVIRFLPFSFLLFITGFIFGTAIMKWQIEIFLARASALGIGNVLDISRLLSMVLLTSVIMGVGFQFPIILLVLMWLRIITRQQVAARRKWFYLGSFLFTILLPADSVIADVFLTLPLIFLFELTLIINRIHEANIARAKMHTSGKSG